ncbi:MAG: sugar phosphate isomerase/epimerase family protein [Caulobacter sp.]|nr:sugar phosphate isomerase/epimerase family protein [Caulobacter sp.]
MKLAVSNIAWSPADRDAAYAILRAAGITGLEIAPGLFFDGAADVFAPTDAEAEAALGAMRKASLELVSMQSLLFGVEGAALFEGEAGLDRLRAGIDRAITLAGRVGIPNLVFGSPRQRNIPDGMDRAVAEVLAIDVFRRFGDAAARAGTRISVEPNPAAYGANFLNRVAEAEAFVRRVAHPAITLIVDVGAMHMNGDFDSIEAVAGRAVGLVSHVHISEPNLDPAPARADQAARVMTAMTGAGYRGWFSIEMKARPEPGLAALEVSVARLVAAAATAAQANPTEQP